jgi:sugar lactone lactonase YvrE
VLPPGTAHPEGITVDAQGNINVADFDVSKSAGPGNVVVFNAAGKLLRKLDVQGSSNLLLGLAFQPQTSALLVLDIGNARVLKVDPLTGASSVFASFKSGAGPNGLTFDNSGTVAVRLYGWHSRSLREQH